MSYKATIVTKFGSIEVSAESTKLLFQEVAKAHEVFGESRCELCESEAIRPVFRSVTKITGKKVEKFEYCEYACDNPRCLAKLSLTPKLDSPEDIFPVRTLTKEGKASCDRALASHGTHRGWSRYRGPRGDAE